MLAFWFLQASTLGIPSAPAHLRMSQEDSDHIGGYTSDEDAAPAAPLQSSPTLNPSQPAPVPQPVAPSPLAAPAFNTQAEKLKSMEHWSEWVKLAHALEVANLGRKGMKPRRLKVFSCCSGTSSESFACEALL